MSGYVVRKLQRLKYSIEFLILKGDDVVAEESTEWISLIDRGGLVHVTELMIMASHQTFSGQVKHLSSQTKFGQTNLLYIINGEVIKFTKEKQMSGQFSVLIISTVLLMNVSSCFSLWKLR